MHIRSLLAVVALATAAQSAGAQSSDTSTRVPIKYRSYISINPLGIPFDLFSAEVESGIAQGMTLGASASHIDVGDERYSSADFKFRYYPSEIVLRGISVGASFGMLRYSDIRFGDVRESLDTPTFGVILDYNWMLGAQRRFLVGTGIGAKRILASSEERERVGLDRAQITGRFTVGIAF
jgi:hypothetical protein